MQYRRLIFVFVLTALLSGIAAAQPLIPLPATRAVELVSNPGFETSIDGWTQTGKSGDKVTCAAGKAHTGNCAFQFKGSANEEGSLQQNITGVTLQADDTLQFSAWVKANSAAARGKLKIQIVYGDGTASNKKVKNLRQTAGYELVSGTIKVKSANIAKIKLQIQHTSKSGKLLIDDLSLIELEPPVKLTASDGAGLDFFGTSMALDSDTLVVGAFTNVNPLDKQAGAVYVYTRNGTTWTEVTKLTASDATAEDNFGNSIALEGDTLVVGATGAGDSNQGAVYVFSRNGTTWTEVTKLTVSDATMADGFGNSIALEGNTLVVGAREAGSSDQGAVYVFSRTGTTWTEVTKLTASNYPDFALFGSSIALASDLLAVSASNIDAVYVFTRTGTTWTEEAKLVANNTRATTLFGFSVALDETTLVVGAPFASTSNDLNEGAAYVFTRTGTTWTQVAKLIASNAKPDDGFGYAVALEGDRVLLGAPALYAPDTGKVRQGAAYLFTRTDTTWTQSAKLTANDGVARDSLGEALTLNNGTAVIGAPQASIAGNGAQGAAYVFTLP